MGSDQLKCTFTLADETLGAFAHPGYHRLLRSGLRATLVYHIITVVLLIVMVLKTIAHTQERAPREPLHNASQPKDRQ